MFGRGLASLAAIAALLVVGPSAAAAQENPVLDPESVKPVIPYSAGGQLDARERDLEELKQRHPWVPNDAPWPWNMTVAQGSWTNSNGSVTIIECGVEVASDNPYWYQENLRYTRWAGGARCNHTQPMRAITGSAELIQWNGLEPSFRVDSATIGTQHEVPPGHGFGWQAYALDTYTRVSDAQNLQIHVEVTLEIQPWGTGARWNIVPNACTRDANIRIIHCQLWSPPFRNAPYACPMWTVGVQPLPCTTPPTPPQPCSQPELGVEPNCLALPKPCTSPQIGLGPVCLLPPPSCPPGQVGGAGQCVTPPSEQEINDEVGRATDPDGTTPDACTVADVDGCERIGDTTVVSCPPGPPYTVYYLGSPFEGLAANEAEQFCEPYHPVMGRNVYVSYWYGDCAPPSTGEGGCPAPIEVQSAPLCERHALLYTDGPPGEEIPHPHIPLTIRGVPAASFDGGTTIEIYTGVTTIAIFGNDPAQVRRAADAVIPAPAGAVPAIDEILRNLGGSAGAQTESSSNLPPPDQATLEATEECAA